MMSGEAPASGGITPIGSPEVDALRSRLEAAETGWVYVKVQHGTSDLASAMKEQTKAMVEAMASKGKNSTMRVEPRITWPKLGDDDTGGREVEELYERLEEIYGLANNGKGMSPK